MGRPKGKLKGTTSVSVSPEFWDFCSERNISFTDMLALGIRFKMAEVGAGEYSSQWQIVKKALDFREKMNTFRVKLEDSGKKIEEMKAKLEKYGEIFEEEGSGNEEVQQ